MDQKHISKMHNWTITLAVAALACITASAPCYADTFGLTNQWYVGAVVNGATGPITDMGCYGCFGGLIQTPVPLTNTVTLNNSGDGGSATATMTNSADYGFLSVSGSGSATNSSLTGAGSFVTNYVGGAPLVSYTDTLHITSSAGAPDGTPATLQFAESFAGNLTQDLPIGGTGSFFLYDLLQLPYTALQLNATGTQTITFDTTVGASFSFSDSLYAADFSWANALSPPTVTSSFSYSGTGPTFVTSLSPDVSISSASGHDYAPTSPVPEPETYAMLLAGLGLLGVMTRRRKQQESP